MELRVLGQEGPLRVKDILEECSMSIFRMGSFEQGREVG